MNVQIFKNYFNYYFDIQELVQNADDAEASVMKVLYDGRTLNEEHPNEKKYRIFLRVSFSFTNSLPLFLAVWGLFLLNVAISDSRISFFTNI
jgi:hypothetical protein